MASFTSFEQLECWKACRVLAKWIREMITMLPKNESDLRDNILRAVRSTTKNIAEGFGRFHYQENIQFCRISRGSLFEIMDDLINLKEENLITQEKYNEGRHKIDYAIKILNGYIHYSQKQKETLKPQPPITS